MRGVSFMFYDHTMIVGDPLTEKKYIDVGHEIKTLETTGGWVHTP